MQYTLGFFLDWITKCNIQINCFWENPLCIVSFNLVGTRILASSRSIYLFVLDSLQNSHNELILKNILEIKFHIVQRLADKLTLKHNKKNVQCA